MIIKFSVFIFLLLIVSLSSFFYGNYTGSQNGAHIEFSCDTINTNECKGTLSINNITFNATSTFTNVKIFPD